MATPEPSVNSKRVLELWGTWQHVGACLTLCLGSKPIRGVPGLQGADKYRIQVLSIHLPFRQLSKRLEMVMVMSKLSTVMNATPPYYKITKHGH
jgi:hypothetical protein